MRAKEEEAQNVKEFLYRVIESRDQWRREAQRLRALMAKVPTWLLFCGRCLDALKASREGLKGLTYIKAPHGAREQPFAGVRVGDCRHNLVE